MILKKINQTSLGILSLVLIDQIIKFLNINIIVFDTSFFGFSLTYVNNYGMSFGWLSGGRWIFILATFFFFALIYKYKEEFKNCSLWLNLMIAGAISNLIDRIVHGYVIDMFAFRLFNYSFHIFNFADVLITIGLFGIIIVNLSKNRR